MVGVGFTIAPVLPTIPETMLIVLSNRTASFAVPVMALVTTIRNTHDTTAVNPVMTSEYALDILLNISNDFLLAIGLCQ